MVDRSYTRTKKEEAVVHLYETVEAEMTQNDTVTLGEFSSATALLAALIINLDTGATITNSIALNAVTMTGAGTNVKVVVFAFGVKA